MKIQSRYITVATTLTAIGMLSGAPVAAAGQPSTDRIGVQSTVTNPKANQVLTDLHRSNAMEMEMGKLAQSKSPDQSVRDFGQALVKDHEDAQRRVTALASDRNLAFSQLNDTTAGESATTHKNDHLTQLDGLKGVEFDRAFLKQMIEDHTQAVKSLRGVESKLSDSPDVKKLVQELIPVFEKHLSSANDLLKQVGKTGLSGQPS